MRRGAKPAKAKVEAKLPVGRKSRMSQGSKVRDLEKRLAESFEREKATGEVLQETNRALTEALEQQTATSEILRVISSSPTDPQPVFDTIARSAARLCDAPVCGVARFDGEVLDVAATHGYGPEALEFLRQRFPRRAGRETGWGRAVLERHVIHLHDVTVDAEYEGFSTGYRTLLAVPMLRKGTALGAIAIWRREVKPFSDQQIALVETFADQAVIAIENVRLFAELQEKNGALTQAHAQVSEALEQETATAAVLRVISSSPTNVQPVFDAIAASAVRLCGARIATVFHFDGELIHLIAHHGYTPEALELRRGLFPAPPHAGSVTGRAILNRAVVHVADALADGTYPYRDFARAAEVRSVIAVPMLRDGRPIGAVTVSRAEPGAFAERQIELLKTFAAQALIAIENLRLFREIEEKSRELETLSRNMEQLYRLSMAMQEPLSLKEQLSRVLEIATRIGLLDRIYVWAVSPEGDKLVNLAGAGFAEDESKQFEGFALPLVEAGAMYRSLREGRPLLFDDENPLPRDLYLKPQYLLKGLRTSRFLIIPMIARGETVGVFAGDNKPSGRPIARETVELLQTFASHGAVAIANARLFQTIAEKSRELEVASQHKSEFLANMSHELRTPLNAIIGFSEVLSERMFGDLNEKQEEYLKDIYASGTHLLSLINDILDLSKIEAGRMELELTDFDLPQAIDNALTLVRERAGRRGIALHQSVSERLGEVRGDERKVKQVLLNLLSNALKFTPEGGRVGVRAGMVDGMAEISVTDTGVGIAPEDQEAVFEEFRQVGTSAARQEGTGLGLALCRKFVELHGGKIGVTSQVGVGSTFTFTIPIRRGE